MAGEILGKPSRNQCFSYFSDIKRFRTVTKKAGKIRTRINNVGINFGGKGL